MVASADRYHSIALGTINYPHKEQRTRAFHLHAVLADFIISAL